MQLKTINEHHDNVDDCNDYDNDNDEDDDYVSNGWLPAILAAGVLYMVRSRGLKPEKRIKEPPMIT